MAGTNLTSPEARLGAGSQGLRVLIPTLHQSARLDSDRQVARRGKFYSPLDYDHCALWRHQA
jgi:hypothetical protein